MSPDIFMCSANVLLAVVALNIVLSALHWFLEWLYAKTGNKCSGRLAMIVGWLLSLMEWVMAARGGRR
jgi:hypothetical protein